MLPWDGVDVMCVSREFVVKVDVPHRLVIGFGYKVFQGRRGEPLDAFVDVVGRQRRQDDSEQSRNVRTLNPVRKGGGGRKNLESGLDVLAAKPTAVFSVVA